MMLGNVMCTVMTVALAFLMDYTITKVVLTIFTLFVFFSLIFTVAYKDGVKERMFVKNHHIETAPKSRWLKIGACMWLVMIIPTIILILLKLFYSTSDFMITYRLVCGAVYPLSFLLGIADANLQNMSIICPIIFMAVYALMPVAAEIGYRFGFDDKFNADKIMYEKK